MYDCPLLVLTHLKQNNDRDQITEQPAFTDRPPYGGGTDEQAFAQSGAASEPGDQDAYDPVYDQPLYGQGSSYNQ
jgi:hypothetical protein